MVNCILTFKYFFEWFHDRLSICAIGQPFQNLISEDHNLPQQFHTLVHLLRLTSFLKESGSLNWSLPFSPICTSVTSASTSTGLIIFPGLVFPLNDIQCFQRFKHHTFNEHDKTKRRKKKTKQNKIIPSPGKMTAVAR